jgi:dihydropteroate synthase
MCAGATVAAPAVVGASRKGFLGKLRAASDGAAETVPTDDRLEGSIATATWAMAQGVAMVRVHDVRPTVHAAKVVAA